MLHKKANVTKILDIICLQHGEYIARYLMAWLGNHADFGIKEVKIQEEIMQENAGTSPQNFVLLCRIEYSIPMLKLHSMLVDMKNSGWSSVERVVYNI